MTSHELARILLAGPDLIVTSFGSDPQVECEVDSVEESSDLMEYQDRTFSHQPHIVIT